jgi:hypothetical protein
MGAPVKTGQVYGVFELVEVDVGVDFVGCLRADVFGVDFAANDELNCELFRETVVNQ